MALLGKTYLQPGEVAAQHSENVCRDESRGYSQPNRKGNGTDAIYTLSDGTRYTDDGGDIDCSELGLDCYRIQGIDVGGATYSRNMDELVYTGNFVDVGTNPKNWSRGDLLVVPGHVAIWLGNGMLAEAHHGDFPGGLSGRTGDQDGTEVRIRSYYDDGWTNVYHCTIVREQPKNGWIEEDGKWYFYADGKKLKNHWEKWKGFWYYLGDDGAMYRDQWIKDGGYWYYLGSDGKMVKGYQQCGTSDWYYFDGAGRMLASQPVKHMGGKGWCWLDSKGRCMQSGSLKIESGIIKA